MSRVEEAHHRFIDYLIARGSLWSRPLIDAFRATPRHLFLDQIYHYQRHNGAWREVRVRHLGRAELKLIYSDRALTTRLSPGGPGLAPVPISSSSQPSLMAQMLEDLCLRPGLRVLEVGAGTGYNAALLAYVVGRGGQDTPVPPGQARGPRFPGSVTSIDVDRQVLAEAREHLRAFPDRPVELVHGDGRLGIPLTASCQFHLPFDRIVVTAATPDLEPAWLRQLREGGLVQAPLVLAPGLAYVVQGTVRAGWFEGRLTRPAYFMPLRLEDEAGRPATTSPMPPFPSPEGLESAAAPWDDWGRKFATNGPTFLPALAFLGWLHGHAVAFHTLADGRPFYGIGDPAQGRLCWLGLGEWRVRGKEDRAFGEALWRAWLDAGGPWPTEFRLRIPFDERNGREAALPAGGLCFRRCGAIHEQLWELIEPRDRPNGL